MVGLIVLDLLAAGLSQQQIVEELPDLTLEDIEAALKYAASKLNHPVIAVWQFRLALPLAISLLEGGEIMVEISK